jgi:hypothetical protein
MQGGVFGRRVLHTLVPDARGGGVAAGGAHGTHVDARGHEQEARIRAHLAAQCGVRGAHTAQAVVLALRAWRHRRGRGDTCAMKIARAPGDGAGGARGKAGTLVEVQLALAHGAPRGIAVTRQAVRDELAAVCGHAGKALAPEGGEVEGDEARGALIEAQSLVQVAQALTRGARVTAGDTAGPAGAIERAHVRVALARLGGVDAGGSVRERALLHAGALEENGGGLAARTHGGAPRETALAIRDGARGREGGCKHASKYEDDEQGMRGSH